MESPDRSSRPVARGRTLGPDRPSTESPSAGGKRLVRAFIIQTSNRDLPEMVFALGATGRLARRLNCRKQQRHENADDRDDNQQLDQRKSLSKLR